MAWAHSWDIGLIFLFLGLVVPWRGRVRLRELLALPEVSSSVRINLYLSTILFQWLAVAISAWRAWVHQFTVEDLALRRPGLGLMVGSLAGAAAISLFQWYNLRRVGRASERGAVLRRIAKAIFPHSSVELGVFLGLAVTAGICEEFLYRGFAFAVFLRAGLPTWMVILASSALFGLAHLYQGRGGLVATLVLGLLFGAVRTLTASLVPVVFCHAAVDIAAGIAGPRFLLRTPTAETDITVVKSITY